MHIKIGKQHCNVLKPKNLTPWLDSNLESSVLEADAMTTMPRRQGNFGQISPRRENVPRK
jgi:hypothetical protein